MVLFAALNASGSSSSSDDEDEVKLSEEALETEAFLLYNRALGYLASKNVSEAKNLFLKITSHPFVVKNDSQLSKLPDGSLHPSRHMKYAALKNLAQISIENDEDHEQGCEYYLRCLDIDATDVTAWYKLGNAALKLKNFPMAAEAFHGGLVVNPKHWLCLDSLLVVRYVLADDVGCLQLVADALSRDPNYTRALLLKKRILGHSTLLQESWDDLKERFAIVDGEGVEKADEEELDVQLKELISQHLEYCAPKPEVLPEPIQISLPESHGPSWMRLGDSLCKTFAFIDKCWLQVDVLDWRDATDVAISNLMVSLIANENPSEEDPEKKADLTDSALKEVQKKAKKRPRTSELSRLEEWGFVKRRSVRSGASAAKFAHLAAFNRSKSQVGVSFEELLAEFLPPSLLQLPSAVREKEALSSESTLCSAETSQLSEAVCSASNSGDESSLSREPQSEVKERLKHLTSLRNFLHDMQGEELHAFLYKWCISVSKDENVWEKGLPQVFLKVYAKAREWTPHYVRTLNSKGYEDEVYRSFISDDSWLTLKAADLFADRRQFWASDDRNTQNHEQPDTDFHDDEFESLIMVLASSKFISRWPEFYIRLCVLQVRLAIISDRMNDALYYLELVKEWLENTDSVDIKLPNCFFFQSVDKASVEKQIAELGQQQSLTGIMDLYDKGDFSGVVDILLPTLTKSSSSVGIEARIKDLLDRHLLLQITVDSVVQLKEYQKLFEIAPIVLEECLRNFESVDESGSQGKDEWSTALVYVLEVLDSVLFNEENVLCGIDDSSLAALGRACTKVIQMNFDFVNNSKNISTSADRRKMLLKTLTPWGILHRLCVHGEQEIDMENVPGSVYLLVTAHEWLGRHAWCCNDGGTLLLLLIEVISKLPEALKAKDSLLDRALEQCFFCLYSYPSKKTKAKHLADHGVNGIELTWDRAVDLYRFVVPEELPEFDSYRVSTISADLEALLRRIASLADVKNDPATYCSDLERYIDGEGGKVYVMIPKNALVEMRRMPDLFFFLADYYLKSKEWNKAAKYYLYDSTINPMRMDSWGGHALARTGALETKLNSCQPIKQDKSIFERTSAALRCFHRTLLLDKKNVKMWIEFGSVSYMMHSHASRQLKLDSSVELGMDMLTYLEKEKENLLAKAKHSFSTAMKHVESQTPEEYDGWDERWLHYFMLGKIMHKFRAPVHDCLAYFHYASELLHEVGATYPKKISYNSPLFLSLEALEVYYRIHATSLKQLMMWEHNIFTDDYEEQVKHMREILQIQEKSGFAKADASVFKHDEEPVISGVIDSILEDVVKECEPELKPRDPTSLECAVERQCLVQKCLNAMKECVSRFPHHYKSIFRCAQYYSDSAQSKDFCKARNILLGIPGRISDWTKYPYMPGPGLFAERKRNNLFNGIWRIPSNEVDRPGSFAAHMARSVSLLIENCVQLKDYSTLLTTAAQLARKPEADKMYLYETERKSLSGHALEMSLVVLREKVNSTLESGSDAAKRDVLLEVYKARSRASKHPVPYHGFSPLLIEAYVGFCGGGLENASGPAILEEATAFCAPLVGEVKEDIEPGDMKRKRLQKNKEKEVNSVNAAGVEEQLPVMDANSGSDSDVPAEIPLSPVSRASSPGDNYVPGKKLPIAVTEAPTSKKRGSKRGGLMSRKASGVVKRAKTTSSTNSEVVVPPPPAIETPQYDMNQLFNAWAAEFQAASILAGPLAQEALMMSGLSAMYPSGFPAMQPMKPMGSRGRGRGMTRGGDSTRTRVRRPRGSRMPSVSVRPVLATPSQSGNIPMTSMRGRPRGTRMRMPRRAPVIDLTENPMARGPSSTADEPQISSKLNPELTIRPVSQPVLSSRVPPPMQSSKVVQRNSVMSELARRPGLEILQNAGNLGELSRLSEIQKAFLDAAQENK
ncbi:unnamed protein product [Notodromas monacha]|uniref:Calcineurin-binding protein cabin-1 n=1 Tax=Notodromas monacha TaxID=399045 RepID=A0A7R9G9Y0_9CRUS|nr:unnamed protein product [Notodromas monacha]CAG0913106.1 unnamed protein product [Notodromas monacha]